MIVLMVEDDKVLSSAISDYLALDNIDIDYSYNGFSIYLYKTSHLSWFSGVIIGLGNWQRRKP